MVKNKVHPQKSLKKNVGVIGCGWYGYEAAIALKKAGFNVKIFEAGPDVASGTSGKFAGRTHPSGLHYLRSRKTRKNCRKDYGPFVKKYPHMLIENTQAIHGLVYSDSQGRPPKVDARTFNKICKGDRTAKQFDTKKHGYQGLQEAVTITEPAIIVGDPLRARLRESLMKEGIPFVCNYPVVDVKRQGSSFKVSGEDSSAEFDLVVNATGFQNLTPKDFDNNPFQLAVRYQPCLGLIYEDTMPGAGNFSFLGLDGANPCVMPMGNNHYMVTHGINTILASCKTPEEAKRVLGRVNVDFLMNTVKAQTEQDMQRYYPDFCKRFKFLRCEGDVIAKPLTNTEFRAGFAMKAPDGVIHTFPGKISNAPRVGKEVAHLATNKQLSKKRGYQYPSKGILASAQQELGEKPTGLIHNTCLSNPYPHLLDPPKESITNLARFSMLNDGRRPRSGSEDLRNSLRHVQI
jgi:hypothetical protein